MGRTMLPIEFDHQSLASLPLVDEARAQGVIRLLRGIIERRVLPTFRKNAAVDAVLLARVSERYRIERLEDVLGRIRTVSILTHSPDGWTIHIHERVFDYISFGIPWDLTAADSAIPAPEGRKALAFAELLLRHELEHMVKPHADEREVILSDAEFAMDRRELDPAYYRTLREALGDELGGLRGVRYLKLLDRFERDENTDDLVAEILPLHAERLAEVPSLLLVGAFQTMGRELKCRVIEACYRMSRNTAYALVERSASLRKVLRLFIEQLEIDQEEFEAIFASFTDRWGVALLLQERCPSRLSTAVRWSC